MVATKIFKFVSLVACLGFFADSAEAQDSRLNSNTQGDQKHIAVASYSGGYSLGVWQSDRGQDGREIRGRFFTPEGPIGKEFPINSITAGNQYRPDVAMDAKGNFVVTWYSDQSAGSDGSGFGVVARRFNADGSALGNDFQVNSLTTSAQMDPAISMAPDGRFVIVWRSNTSLGSDISGASIQARRFAANGSPLGPDSQLNSFTSFDQQLPDVAMYSNGDFVAVWQSMLQDGSVDGVYLRRFAASGSPLSGELSAPQQKELSQTDPAVAISGSTFCVVWTSELGDAQTDVRARVFKRNGSANSAEFSVATETEGYQGKADVTGVAGGYFIAWQSTSSSDGDDFGYSIQGRTLSLTGQGTEPEFQLNATAIGSQLRPAVSSAAGVLAIGWEADLQSGSEDDVFSTGVVDDALAKDRGFVTR